MADRLIRAETLAEIAGAIRVKNEEAGSMSPGDMARLILQTGHGNVPAYHNPPLREAVKKIFHLQDTVSRLLVFGVMADSHVHIGTDLEAMTKTSARHAAYILENMAAWAGCSFLANLGDNCWGGDLDTPEDAAAAKFLDGCITAGFDRLRSFRLVGEHDRASDPDRVYELNGVHNVFDQTAATPRRGYGYFDHPGKKVRIIALNTSDCCGAAAGFGMSYEQKAFLMRALDLSGKADASQWQILILSHYPLDWAEDVRYGTAADVKAILDAYVSGGTARIAVQSAWAAAEAETPAEDTIYNSGSLVYDYSGKNGARIIANIHGHVHNASFGSMEGNQVTRVCTPNACFYLENGSVGDRYPVEASQPKTALSAEDTAVTLYAVDLDGGVIHSIACGAGADRVIEY